MLTKFPVVEVFGPTLQGEGAVAGQRCSFVRLAFCDWDCLWCDTKYATNAEGAPEFTMMGAEEIADALCKLNKGFAPKHATLTGGNPVMQPHADYLFDAVGPRTNWNVETQGSLFQEWLNHPQVGSVTMSPKLVYGPGTADALDWACKIRRNTERLNVKIVVFHPRDLDAVAGYYVMLREHCAEFIIQVGTVVGQDTPLQLLHRYRQLAEAVLDNEHLTDVRVLPQMHVLLWKHETGV